MSRAGQRLPEALAAFDFGAPPSRVEQLGTSHINDTFLVYVPHPPAGQERYVLQRLSSEAFAHPDELMANMVHITDYLKEQIALAGGDPDRETLSILRTRAGRDYYTDGEGRAWRACPFVSGTVCLQQADTPELFYAAARAFGRFQRMLKDYPAHTLYETIPHFHDTEDRLLHFKTALEEDPLGRAREVSDEVKFVLRHREDCSVAMSALRAGRLPLRVTHNDTKLNNVLLDEKTGQGLCVIDLDTVMPGLSINDFGDAIRFGATHAAEDETDLSRVDFDLSLFEIYTKGFLEEAGGFLTPAELSYLPWGAKLMTLECGIRFLTDYLEGDRYFAIHRPRQNLDRCRTQFKLVSEMEKHWDEMAAIITKYSP